jgi:SSS family solute:Na+ symporter
MKVAVVQTVLLCIGLLILGSLALDHVGGFDVLNQGLANLINTEHSYLGTTSGMGGGNFDGYLALPGVIQWTSGIGFEVPIGGHGQRSWGLLSCYPS